MGPVLPAGGSSGLLAEVLEQLFTLRTRTAAEVIADSDAATVEATRVDESLVTSLSAESGAGNAVADNVNGDGGVGGHGEADAPLAEEPVVGDGAA